MKALIKGIERFQTGVYKSKKKLFEQLAHGQKPHTLLITCSDSRIQPDVITGCGAGRAVHPAEHRQHRAAPWVGDRGRGGDRVRDDRP